MITLTHEIAAVEAAVELATRDAARADDAKGEYLGMLELSLDDLQRVGGGIMIYQW